MAGMIAGRARELLERAAEVRVLVVGDVMLDRYVQGVVDRMSPEAPVPVVRLEAEWCSVGGAANVAANVTALGAACALIGVAGADEEGALLGEGLRAHGVEAGGVVWSEGRPTTVKTRVLAGQRQVVRLDREVERDAEGPLAELLARRVREACSDADVVVLQDYDKGTLADPVVAAALEAAAAGRVPVVVDPKRRRFFSYAGATVLKPNAKELEDALGEPPRPDDPDWMEAVRVRLDCEHLLVTLGAEGISLRSRGSDSVRLPAVARGVFDVSGAGDTVTAAVAVVLGAGGTVPEAAELANHAAALEVGKPGVATVSGEELAGHVGADMAEEDRATTTGGRNE